MAGVVAQTVPDRREYPDAGKTFAGVCIIFLVVVWIAHLTVPLSRAGGASSSTGENKNI